MGLFSRSDLKFAKAKISKSKIDSDKSATITVNLKNKKQTFDKIIVKTKTDDENAEYLTVDKATMELPPLEYPNKNTGDHEVTITPFNIPLNEMPFTIIVEVYANDSAKVLLKKEFSLTIHKK